MGNFVHQDVDVSVVIGDRWYLPTKVETDFDRYNRSDMVKTTVVPEDGSGERWTVDHEPQNNDDFELYINGTLVFTGFVQQSGWTKEGAFKVKAMDAVRKLKTEAVTLSVTGNSTLISQIVAKVCQDVGVDYQIELNTLSQSQQRQLMQTTTGTDDMGPIDYPVKIERDSTQAAAVLDTLRKKANADWWVTNDNVVRFGLPDSQLHEVQYVKESSAGMSTPPYRGVKVIGSVEASESNSVKENAISGKRGVAKYGMWYDDGQRQTDDISDIKGKLRIKFESSGVIIPGMKFSTKDDRTYKATERVNVDMSGMADEKTKTVTVEVEAVGDSLNYEAKPHTITENVTGPMQIISVTNPHAIGDWKTERQKEQNTEAGWKIQKGVTNSPVYTVKDKEIEKQKELDVVARSLITNLRKQVVSGEVTIVGNAEIDTLDVIQLPQFMGGEKYFVGKVNHRLDSNGFTTKIGCEGLVPGRYHGDKTVDFDGAGGFAEEDT